MRFTIWKFKLELTGEIQHVEMPSAAKILSCQLQDESICVWARVDLDRGHKEERNFRLVRTGHDIDSDIICWDFVSTVQQGSIVWHVFIYRS